MNKRRVFLLIISILLVVNISVAAFAIATKDAIEIPDSPGPFPEPRCGECCTVSGNLFGRSAPPACSVGQTGYYLASGLCIPCTSPELGQ